MLPARILVRATNWVGDAVMSLPALQTVRRRFPEAEITVLARPWVADLYRREPFADRVLLYEARPGARDWQGKWRAARRLRAGGFDAAILLPNSFESALVAWLARIPKRIGYRRDGRGPLLTDPVPRPAPGEIPRHESYYYLEMLRRAGLLEELPRVEEIRLEGAGQARRRGRERLRSEGMGPGVVGVSPGAAFGSAKRWLPERFAEAAAQVAARTGFGVAVFGSAGEREICETVARELAAARIQARNFAGRTSLAEFIELAAGCRLFLTNDSGAMHVAAALGVPTVAVFGPTDPEATGPLGRHTRIVREPVECAPCKLRECPIDHRCMTRIEAARVAEAALQLLKQETVGGRGEGHA